ncbi:GNAT family N-acetyltransferase [Thioclava sp. BHET1]|nr:GNAT family N-acetyltransferase [Thioclava sp. BHET1]
MHNQSTSSSTMPEAQRLPDGAAAQMPSEALTRFGAFMRRETLEVAQDWMQVDSYKARIEPIDTSMIAKLQTLTVGVFWPHREADLAVLLEVGAGYLALDEIDRALASTMQFPCGDDFSMLGMMVTTPRLQAMGTGARLLRRTMADCNRRDMRLSATKSGYRLYETAGFVPDGLIYQHQGKARPIHAPRPVPGVSLRPMEPRDTAAVAELDRLAHGVDRSTILGVFLARSEAIVAERDGAVIGYALCRPFGKGRVIGPCICEDEAVAIQMVAHFVMSYEGSFLRFDLHQENERIAAFLSASGLGMFDTVTEMHLGASRRARSGVMSYGMAMQSLG